jgi:hypothetical protein
LARQLAVIRLPVVRQALFWVGLTTGEGTLWQTHSAIKEDTTLNWLRKAAQHIQMRVGVRKMKNVKLRLSGISVYQIKSRQKFIPPIIKYLELKLAENKM